MDEFVEREPMYYARLRLECQKGVLCKDGCDYHEIVFAQYGDDLSGLKAMKALRVELDAVIKNFTTHLKNVGVPVDE